MKDHAQRSFSAAAATRAMRSRKPLQMVLLVLAGLCFAGAIWLLQTASARRAEFAEEARATAEAESARIAAAIAPLSGSRGRIADFLQAAVIGATEVHHGYSVVLSADNRFLFHPLRDLVRERAKLADLAADHPMWATLQDALTDLGTERHRVLLASSAVLGGSTWLSIRRIPNTGWTVAVFYPEIARERVHEARRQTAHALALGLLGVLFLVGFKLARIKTASGWTLWGASLASSAAMAGGVALLWYQALTAAPDVEEGAQALINARDVQRLVGQQQDKSASQLEPPIIVPTGMFLQTLDFTQDGTLVANGYVWQQYPLQVPEGLQFGVLFPDAEDVTIADEPDYRRTTPDGEVLGWHFKLSQRQPLRHARYPLDWETVSLRMWHRDFDRNTILVPDLAAFGLMFPELLPGLDEDLQIKGWQATGSYFSVRQHNYNTNFGIPEYTGQWNFPELEFNILLRRNFLDPFVSYVTPLLVVLLLLFAVQMTVSKQEGRSALLGFNAAAIVASCSALFFVVLVSHGAVRSSLGDQKIFYLEYWYLVTYIAILSSSVNAILFSLNAPLPLLHYRDNLAAKLLFWPATTMLLFAATMFVFY